MIFVTVGSQKFQFNRLLKEIDNLITDKKINPKDVFAQIGYSTYQPQNYTYKKFLDNDEFVNQIISSDVIITHGGTGSIINSLKYEKKVIAIPRDVMFEEHVDNHQYEIIQQFVDSNLICGITNIKDLYKTISMISNSNFRIYKSNTLNFIEHLEEYIGKLSK